VVEGVFEVREQDGVAFTAVNLIDELTYRIYRLAREEPRRRQR
jgi:hypothetical protein